MSIITTGLNPRALRPGVKAFFGREYKKHEDFLPKMYEADTSDKNYELDVEVTGFGLIPAGSQGSKVDYQSESSGYENKATHVVYKGGFEVTEEEMEDNLYETVANRRAQALAFSFYSTKQFAGAYLFNKAADATVTYGDGVPLFSAAHPVAAGGTQANKLSTPADLSEASLEDVCKLIMKARNTKGLPIGLKPQGLIVHPDNIFNATRILKSVGRPGTANNDINALQYIGMIPEAMANPYLDDANAFYVRTNCPRGLLHYTRVPLSFDTDNDFDTGNEKYKGRERYSFSFGDWRGLFGSEGA